MRGLRTLGLIVGLLGGCANVETADLENGSTTDDGILIEDDGRADSGSVTIPAMQDVLDMIDVCMSPPYTTAGSRSCLNSRRTELMARYQTVAQNAGDTLMQGILRDANASMTSSINSTCALLGSPSSCFIELESNFLQVAAYYGSSNAGFGSAVASATQPEMTSDASPSSCDDNFAAARVSASTSSGPGSRIEPYTAFTRCVSDEIENAGYSFGVESALSGLGYANNRLCAGLGRFSARSFRWASWPERTAYCEAYSSSLVLDSLDGVRSTISSL